MLATPPSTRQLPASALGLAVAVAGAAVAATVGAAVPAVSPLLIAIVLGVATANLGLPARTLDLLEPGLAVASKQLLRIGVALLGLQLILPDLVALGPGVLAVAAVVVVAGIWGAMTIGRWLGMGWSERLLIACGFSICGAAAAAAVDGIVDSRRRELVTTVALVVVFGTAMIPLVPLIVDVADLDPSAGAVWAGAAVHEVAQVVAVGTALEATAGGALAVAVTVKLARVALLAPVVAVVGVVARSAGNTRSDGRTPPIVPAFLLGFAACVAIRATGWVSPLVLDSVQQIQTVLLTVAMFALGAGVRREVVRGLGWRPLLLAALATVWVAALAFAGTSLIGGS